MKKFLCFSTLVMGGIPIGMALCNFAKDQWSDLDMLGMFAGLCVVFGGVMAGLNLPFKPDEKLEAEVKQWMGFHDLAAKQRDEAVDVMHRIEKQRDDVLADYERALDDWQKTTDALRQKVAAP